MVHNLKIAKTPVEWKGDMKQGNKLQSVLVNLRRGKKQTKPKQVKFIKILNMMQLSPLSVTHAC